MEDIEYLFKTTLDFSETIEGLRKDFFKRIQDRLNNFSGATQKQSAEDPPLSNVLVDIQNTTATPIQTKKRVKRLSSLKEDELETISAKPTTLDKSPAKSFHDIQDIHMASPKPLPTPAPRNLEKDLAEEKQGGGTDDEAALMPPPPPPPVMQPEQPSLDQSSGRPQRAAKLKGEKNLKEPSINKKLRRPSNDEIKVKVEKEQRASQKFAGKASSAKNPTTLEVPTETAKQSMDSNKAEESIMVIPNKPAAFVELSSDEEEDKENKNKGNSKEQTTGKDKDSVRNLKIKVKREKQSILSQDSISSTETLVPAATNDNNSVPKPIKMKKEKEKETAKDTSSIKSSLSSSALSTTSTSSTGSKKSKKNQVHRPIKVERFSDIDRDSPVSTRSRKKKSMENVPSGTEAANQEEEVNVRPRSIYEDAVDNLQSEENLENPPSKETPNQIASNNTTTVLAANGPDVTRVLDQLPNGTFVMDATKVLGPAPDATMVLGQAPNDLTYNANETYKVTPNAQTTFVMEKKSSNGNEKNISASTKHSMETARDTLTPRGDSLLTEDDSFEEAQSKPEPPAKVAPPPKAKAGAVPKLPTSAKALAKMPSRPHELFNPLVQSPVKKMVEAFEHAAQVASMEKKNLTKKAKENTASNFTTPVIGRLVNQATGRFLTPTQTANLTQSASAALKKAPNSASKAQAFPKATTASAKTLSRENSGDDFRKNLNQLAEERKKQREQKHLLAAQLREAKEKERAERLMKLAKEREEKRIKKKEIEEIQKKLRLQEEIDKKKEIALQQSQQLKQMKQQMMTKTMLPPPPKQTSKYTFEMLHEDDSTDEEGKTSYKRPEPPLWSQSHVRGPAIVAQQSCPTAVIDRFFSVEPNTPDLRLIFPNIDSRHLKRNSSALWATPPRYSELPKY